MKRMKVSILSLRRESIQRAAEDLPYGPRTPQTAKEESGSAMCDIRDFKPLSPLESPSVENCERTHFLQSVLFRRRKKARRARLFSLLQKFAVPFAVLHAAGNPA